MATDGRNSALGWCALRAATLIFTLLTGCHTSGNLVGKRQEAPQTVPATHQGEVLDPLFPYRAGMSREQVRARLAGSALMMSASRPAEGWSPRGRSSISPDRGASARYEKTNPGVRVQYCEVYWVGNDEKPKRMHIPEGMWLTYFFFDASDALVGIITRVID
jgi:hypothetical protein